MPEFDHGIKLITATAGRELALAGGVPCQQWEPLESTLQATTELLADRAFRARQGRDRFVVYFEFYTRWHKDAPWDMLAKAGLLSQREHLPTVCMPFTLRRRGYQAHGEQFRLEALGRTTQELWLHEVRLWELQPQDWWRDVPRLMSLYPLCDHGREAPEAIHFAAEVIERQASQPQEREDDLFLLNIFGALAYPRLDVAGIIGRQKMQESRFSRELRVETRRADVLATVEARFGPESRAAVEPMVNAVGDLEELGRLLRLSVTCADLTELRTSLPRPGTATRRPRRTRRGRSRTSQ